MAHWGAWGKTGARRRAAGPLIAGPAFLKWMLHWPLGNMALKHGFAEIEVVVSCSCVLGLILAILAVAVASTFMLRWRLGIWPSATRGIDHCLSQASRPSRCWLMPRPLTWAIRRRSAAPPVRLLATAGLEAGSVRSSSMLRQLPALPS